jgi:cell wall-associated NlpC family hydrolase
MGAAEAAVRRAGGHVAQIEVVCGGGVFTDPNMPGTVTNPRSAAQAIAWARAQVAGPLVWQYRCLNFVARAYGHTHSGATAADGTAYAINLFRLLPDAVKSTDRDPPPGALVYWETGNPAGHVALYLGGGLVASTDILRDGGVDVVAFTDLERLWGARYVGWSIPEFPNA